MLILTISKALERGFYIWRRFIGMMGAQLWHLSSTIVNLKSLLIYKEWPRPIIFIYCPSEVWTDEMQHNFITARESDIGFIWARFRSTTTERKTSSRKLFIKQEKEFFTIDFPWTYQHHLTHKRGLNILRKTFFFSKRDMLWSRLGVLGLDNDEVITQELMKEISASSEYLNRKTSYSFRRLWVKNEKQVWYKNSLAVSSESSYDLQYRLYKITAAWGYKTWHQNVNFLKKRHFDSNSVIYHIAYKDSFESRSKKIDNMELIEPGSGYSKMRYYCPESLENYNQEIWIPLGQEEQEFLNAINKP